MTSQQAPKQGEGTESRLAFLALVPTPAKDGFVGAILITDGQGVPQEFRCTHSVKPTLVQKSLYGATLEPHIAVTLCGVPLLKAVQQKPNLIIVRDEYLLEVRSAAGLPTVLTRHSGEAIEVKATSESDTAVNQQKISHPHGRFTSITCQVHSRFPGDMEYVRKVLESIFEYVDPLEPFERIALAVDVLGKQDKRFQ
jgi:hypothetical protein